MPNPAFKETESYLESHSICFEMGLINGVYGHVGHIQYIQQRPAAHFKMIWNDLS